MGSRADFYIGIKEPKWIGSINQDGHPWHIPCKLLVQISSTMYEEITVEFLMARAGYIESHGDEWPWPWEDSRMTDYSYIFKRDMDRVIAYSMTDRELFDPLKIKQGEDMFEASIPFIIKFPLMYKQAKRTTEELLGKYGHQPAKAV